MIISLYKTIFYSREDPLLFIPMNDLDLLLRTALESFGFDQTYNIFQSLCQDRHESPFYSKAKASVLNQLWQQQHNNEVEMNRRNEEYLEGLQLQERIRELKQEGESLLNERKRQRHVLRKLGLELYPPVSG